MESGLKQLREVTAVQRMVGNYTYDSYMHGMANGLTLALALMEGKEPLFLDAPERWLRSDK